MSRRSSKANVYFLSGFTPTATVSRSNSRAPCSIIHICPTVSGSKLPAYIPDFPRRFCARMARSVAAGAHCHNPLPRVFWYELRDQLTESREGQNYRVLMNKLFWLPLATGMAIVSVDPASRAQATADSGPPPAVPAEELPAGSEVLTRGPLHEAFAKPVTTDPQAPLVISRQPPEALQEMPPAEKPAGANIVWVPGYWAWDDDRSDFIWVSGCWRNAPPNTYWVPGHWLQLDSGWEWIAGFWKPMTAQGQQEIEYLPDPPPAFDTAAPGNPPTPDQIWVPGCWYWSGGQYIQRPGYWIAPQVGWVWV